MDAARSLAAEAGIDAGLRRRVALRRRGGARRTPLRPGLHRHRARSTGSPTCAAGREVVRGLLAPGGFLYLVEFHPIEWVFADDDLTVERDYFERKPLVFDDPGTYADLEAETVNDRTEEWQHPLSEVVTAVIDSGLVLELLHEHDFTVTPRWPLLEERRRRPAACPTADRGCR